MSKLKPQNEYEKTGAFHFFRWLSGSRDPYMGEVEMKPPQRTETPVDTILERMFERQMMRDKVYDVDHNKKLTVFHRIYVAAAILFCALLCEVKIHAESGYRLYSHACGTY